MNNFLGTFTEAIVDNIISIIGIILAFIFAYFLFIIKEKRVIPKLEYEKILSFSLVSMDKRIRDRIKITYDGQPVNNIFSFRFRIRNVGKAPIREIPITVEFNDKNVKILDIKANFESEDKVRDIELSLDDTKQNRGKFIVNPGLDKGEGGIFDVFTEGNKTADLSLFRIRLGEGTLGIQWRYFKKKEPVLTLSILSSILFVGMLLGLVALMRAAALEQTRAGGEVTVTVTGVLIIITSSFLIITTALVIRQLLRKID